MNERKPSGDDREHVRPDVWSIGSDSTVHLDHMIMAIGAGHIEIYEAEFGQEDDEEEIVFGRWGIPIKGDIPKNITDFYREKFDAGDKVHVVVTSNDVAYTYVLRYMPEIERFPWRLVKE